MYALYKTVKKKNKEVSLWVLNCLQVILFFVNFVLYERKKYFIVVIIARFLM